MQHFYKTKNRIVLYGNGGNGLKGRGENIRFAKNRRKINFFFLMMTFAYFFTYHFFYGTHTGVQDSDLVTFFGIESRSRF